MNITISVSKDILKLSERLAKQLNVSRDKVFEMGVKKLAKSLDNELETGKTNISRKRSESLSK